MAPAEDLATFLARAGAGRAGAALLRKSRTPRTNVKTDLGALQAWCAAVLLEAAKRPAPRVKQKDRGPEAGRELAQLSSLPNGLSRVGEVLARLGILFVVMEHLPGTFLDGAAMCRHDGVPVIALTLRHDRIDNFWFTLLHEFCHVGHHLGEEVSVILDDLEVKSADGTEAEADAFARDALIPPQMWKEALADPTSFSSDDLLAVAREAGVHPAIVAGRWQRDNNDYRRFAKLLGHGEVRARFRS
jgi:HTH-type transcriptional regulator/antitoxin HigA